MLLPSTGIDGPNAILDAIDAQFIRGHSHDRPILEMCRIRDGIVAFFVPLPGDPSIPKDRNGPVGGGNMAERVEEDGAEYKLVHGEHCQ